MRLLSLSLSLSLSLIAAVPAFATEPTPRSVIFDGDNGWKYYPAVIDSHVTGFLAKQTAGSPAPSGFTIVWYMRESNGTWSMHGWSGTSLAAAAESLQTMKAAPNLFSHAMESPTATPTTGESRLFFSTSNGLSLQDPWQVVADTLTPSEMELIVQSGAEGASELTAEQVAVADTASGSGTSSRLSSLARRTEAIVVGGEDGTNAVSGGGSSLCLPRWINLTTPTIGARGPPVETADGGCEYARPTGQVVRNCYQNIQCELSNCTSITTWTGSENITCAKPASGGCPATPACSSNQ